MMNEQKEFRKFFETTVLVMEEHLDQVVFIGGYCSWLYRYAEKTTPVEGWGPVFTSDIDIAVKPPVRKDPSLRQRFEGAHFETHQIHRVMKKFLREVFALQ